MVLQRSSASINRAKARCKASRFQRRTWPENAESRLKNMGGRSEPTIADYMGVCYTTLGEICNVLRQEWGEYQEVLTI